MHLHHAVFLRGFDEALQICKVVACLLFEYLVELIQSVFQLRERRPLMHSCFPYPSIPGQNQIQIAVGIMEHLNLIEHIISIWSILKIHFLQICVIWFTFFSVVNLVLDFFFRNARVYRDEVIFFVLIKDFSFSLLFRLTQKVISILGEIVCRLCPIFFLRVGHLEERVWLLQA